MNEINQLKKLMETIEPVVNENGDFNVKRELYAEIRSLVELVKKSTDTTLLTEVYDDIMEAQQTLGQALQNDR